MFGASLQVDRGVTARVYSSSRRPRRRRGLGLVLAGCLLAALVAGGAGAADPTFAPATGSPFAAGNTPYSVAVADLNGDGKPDLAVANQGSNNVSILLGDGAADPTFAPATGSPVALDGDTPTSLAVADLNGDGKPDLAVANIVSDNVSILLGDGAADPTFVPTTGSPVAAGSGPISVAVADLNLDGKPDLAVANNGFGPSDVSVLLGDGAADPTFVPATGSPVAAGSLPSAVAVADLNGDGKPDLAVANNASDDVSILLGDGAADPTFAPATGSPFAAGTTPTSLAVADLNGDGKPDLAVTNQFTNGVTILLGDGAADPTFAPATGSPVALDGNAPYSIAVADLNGDGKPDLAVPNSASDDVSILLGDGAADPTFVLATGSPFAADDGPGSVAVADLNGDGKPDLALGNVFSHDVTILLNTSAPTAVAIRSFEAARTGGGVVLRWRTGAEVELLGFDVYRSGVKLNRRVIAARGRAAGATYRLVDRSGRARAASTYRLQAIHLDGTRAWIGRTVARR